MSRNLHLRKAVGMHGQGELFAGKQFGSTETSLGNAEIFEGMCRDAHAHFRSLVAKVADYEQQLVLAATQEGVMPFGIEFLSIVMIDVHQVVELSGDECTFAFAQGDNPAISGVEFPFFGCHDESVTRICSLCKCGLCVFPYFSVGPERKKFLQFLRRPIVEDGCTSVATGETFGVIGTFSDFLPCIDHQGIVAHEGFGNKGGHRLAGIAAEEW